MGHQHWPNRRRAQSTASEKSRTTVIHRAASKPKGLPLTQSERLEGCPITRFSDRQTVVALEACDRRARRRPHQTVHGVAVIPKTLKLRLHTCDHLPGIPVLIAIDRLVIRIGVVVGIVTVGWIPIIVVPVIISAAKEGEPAKAASPPTTIMMVTIVTPVRIRPIEVGGALILPVCVRP